MLVNPYLTTKCKIAIPSYRGLLPNRIGTKMRQSEAYHADTKEICSPNPDSTQDLASAGWTPHAERFKCL